MASIIETVKKGLAASLLVAVFAGSQVNAMAEKPGLWQRATARVKRMTPTQRRVAVAAAAAAATAAALTAGEFGYLGHQRYQHRKAALAVEPALVAPILKKGATADEKAAYEAARKQYAADVEARTKGITWGSEFKQQRSDVAAKARKLKEKYQEVAPTWLGGNPKEGQE